MVSVQRKFQNLTRTKLSVEDNSFAVYRRPSNSRYIEKGNTWVDNGWVVPYNMGLLKKYQAHINVEWCNKGIFIKYLFKYVTKGADRGKVIIQRLRNGELDTNDGQTKPVDEVKEYLDCRYICEQDACWRIFGFDIHKHYPSVERLPVHLLDDNCIVYDPDTDITDLASEEFLRKTMLTEWFLANQLGSWPTNLVMLVETLLTVSSLPSGRGIHPLDLGTVGGEALVR